MKDGLTKIVQEKRGRRRLEAEAILKKDRTESTDVEYLMAALYVARSALEGIDGTSVRRNCQVAINALQLLSEVDDVV